MSKIIIKNRLFHVEKDSPWVTVKFHDKKSNNWYAQWNKKYYLDKGEPDKAYVYQYSYILILSIRIWN